MKKLNYSIWTIVFIFTNVLSMGLAAEPSEPSHKTKKELKSNEVEQQKSINNYLLDPQTIKETDKTPSNDGSSAIKARSYKDLDSTRNNDSQPSEK